MTTRKDYNIKLLFFDFDVRSTNASSEADFVEVRPGSKYLMDKVVSLSKFVLLFGLVSIHRAGGRGGRVLAMGEVFSNERQTGIPNRAKNGIGKIKQLIRLQAIEPQTCKLYDVLTKS